MEITKSMYLLAKEIVKEYENQRPKKTSLTVSKEKEYSSEVHDCFNKCLVYFDEHLFPNDKQRPKWLDTIDKLNRLDKIPFDVIVSIVKFTRADKFWRKNFQSLLKLRNTNREGVKYVIVFNELMKSNTKPSKTETTYNAMNEVLRGLENN